MAGRHENTLVIDSVPIMPDPPDMIPIIHAPSLDYYVHSVPPQWPKMETLLVLHYTNAMIDDARNYGPCVIV